jgi:hypothetical protein
MEPMVANFERNEESFYIPLIKTLEIVLSDTKMADLIIYKKDEGVPAGSYPKHGSKYQIHPFFRKKQKSWCGFNCRTRGWAQQTPSEVTLPYITEEFFILLFKIFFPNVHLLAVLYW